MISPLDKKLLKCIAVVLDSKASLVKSGKCMFDAQFMALVGFSGFPTYPDVLSVEVDYFEEIGLLKRLKIKDNHVNATHYTLTSEGRKALE